MRGLWLHTSGIVILPIPGQFENCRTDVDTIKGIEVVKGEQEACKFIAILETDSVEGQEYLLRQVQALESVAVAELVCHHFGDEDASPSPSS
jgi:nitrate reductase NapAB chaperone NapD